MLKLKILALLLTTFSLIGNAQEQPKTPTAGQIFSAHYARTYQAAIRYNDYEVAKQALYNLLVENPKNDSILYSLSLLYYQTQQYASAVLTAQDILSVRPDHLGAIEIAAISYENLGLRDKALDQYESLYLNSDDYQTLYKIAFLQYELGRYNESKTNADILMNKKETAELKTTYEVGEQQKEFPIKVALLNLKGLISKAQGDKAKAKSFFEEALKISPDFQMAKDNIASLNK